MASWSDKAKRELFRGSLDVLVLSVLADGRQYGYGIERRIGEASGQSVKAGTLYPLLQRFEGAGWVESEQESDTGRPRKWYRLTPAGRAHFRAAAAEWQAGIARLQGQVLPAVRRSAHRNNGQTS